MAATAKTYSWRTYDVYPEHVGKFRREFIRTKPIWERYGAKVIGQYRVCAGGSNTFTNFLEFPSAQAQMQAVFAVRKDPDFKELQKDLMHCVRTIHTPSLRTIPHWAVQTPDPNSKIVVRRYVVRGLPAKAVDLFKPAMQSSIEKYITPGGMKMIGAFFPAYTNTVNAIYVFIELPTDKCIDAMESWLHTAWNDTKYHEPAPGTVGFGDVVSGFSMKMFAPAQRSAPLC